MGMLEVNAYGSIHDVIVYRYKIWEWAFYNSWSTRYSSRVWHDWLVPNYNKCTGPSPEWMIDFLTEDRRGPRSRMYEGGCRCTYCRLLLSRFYCNVSGVWSVETTCAVLVSFNP